MSDRGRHVIAERGFPAALASARTVEDESTLLCAVWNGATPPLGYKLIQAEKRGAKVKKKLEIDPVEAETVRLIFKLYILGDGSSGAWCKGNRQVAEWSRLSDSEGQELRGWPGP